MKVLLINQFFWPETAPTGQLLADVAERLVDDGCEVSVVCGRNSGDVDRGPGIAGVRVWRAPVFPFGRGRITRVLSYLSFFAAALWRALLRERPDVVLTLTTPPLLALVGTLSNWSCGARHFIWEMDVYPDVAVDLGLLRPDGWWTRSLFWLAHLARRRAEGIIVLGPCMRERLLRHGIPAEKLHMVENWADGELIRPRQRREADGMLRVLYSGNLGLAHETETICAAMEALKDDGRFQFIFAGSGSRRTALQEFCRSRELNNVIFRPYCDRVDLADELGKADIGLVTQRTECLGATAPSKIYGLMAAGRPYLFIGPRAATPSRHVEMYGCGWQVDCGDSGAVVDLLQRLAMRPELVRQAGNRARNLFVREYDRPLGTARISKAIGAARPVRKYQTAGAS